MLKTRGGEGHINTYDRLGCLEGFGNSWYGRANSPQVMLAARDNRWTEQRSAGGG